MLKGQVRKSIILLAILTVLIATVGAHIYTTTHHSQCSPKTGVKNVIILIGDGMGFAHVRVTELVYGHLNMTSQPYWITAFGQTYSLSGEVTDSAAAGTAIATGFKTYNGMISTVKLNGEIKNVATLLEVAQYLGKSTGLVTTTRITHATPAVFAAHVEDRDMEKEIAKQLILSKVNVLFGGGKREFDSETIELAKRLGYKVIYTRDELKKVEGDYILGLFADSHIPYVLDRDENIPSLLEMTKKAIEILEKNPNGFFLMVEGGRIDHAAHANDIASVVAETKEFDEVVGYCLKYAMERGDTIVIVLADHETGGLAVGLKHGHSIDTNKILEIKRSIEFMVKEIKKGKDIAEVVEIYTGIKLTDEEIRYIEEKAKENPKYGLGNALGEIISKRVGVGFASHKHTGEPIPIMVYGPGAEMFRGFLHHVDTSRLIAKDMLFGTYTPTNIRVMPSDIKGDINGNCMIDLDDAYIALTFVGNVADNFTAIIDMDNNGLIDYKDVVTIYNQAIR